MPACGKYFLMCISWHALPEGGRMGYTKRTLQELDLIDNFPSNAIASNEEVNEPFYRLLLSALLGRELKKIRVLAQKMIPPAKPGLRGIRMDVEVTEYDEGIVASIYNFEPHRRDQLHLPRHNRYCQARIDGRYVRSGLKDFSKIPNLYVITITNYDLFGRDYMMYTVRNRCEEVPEMGYDDGLKLLYFYTEGTKGGQAIKNMLTYFQDSESKNAVDEATRKIDSYVKRVKGLPEVEAGHMTLGDWVDGIVGGAKEEAVEKTSKEVTGSVTKKVTEENIKIFIETFQKYQDTKENAVEKIRVKFPEYADRAGEFVEKYWKEN